MKTHHVAVAGLLAATVHAQAEPLAVAASTTAPQPARFSAPIEFTADGKPLRGILYPSPTLHDSNGDGKAELWIGDLRGYVKVATHDKGSAFGALEDVKTHDKKLLKLHNW